VKKIVILGSTGSIGTQTLNVVSSFPDDFKVVGLSAGSNLDLLEQQVLKFHPSFVYYHDHTDLHSVTELHGSRFTSMEEMASDPQVDLVMVATSGRVGLEPTLAALRSGKKVALANKEVIVMAGELITSLAEHTGAQLLPVDSEPSAIWQCLRGEDKDPLRIFITASGGAFRNRPPQELFEVTPEQALQHPTWNMGRKITVDSATLMNKAFEVMESHWLFGIPWESINVVIHPQSIIHSMVEFVDGSIKAQLGPPDMRLPIQYSLFYPQRVANYSLPRLDPLTIGSLSFSPLIPEQYPCFQVALDALKRGGTYPAVVNAADEVAVGLFLNRRIGFMDIYQLIQETVRKHTPSHQNTLEAIIEADFWAREHVMSIVRQ